VEYKLHCYFASNKQLAGNFFFAHTTVTIKSHGEKCEEINTSVRNAITYEVLIDSEESEDTIKQVVDLLCCAYTVISGYNYYDCVELTDQIRPEVEKTDWFWAGRPLYYFEANDNWYYAILLARLAYGNQSHMNAICRYHTAHEIVNLHPLDLEPHNDLFSESYLLSEQMRISNCLVICYSILEEIGLQAPNLSRGQSLLNEAGTCWNQDIYKKTTARLLSFHIDPSEKILWLNRCEFHCTARNIPIDDVELCEWSSGIIKDHYITPVDAILELKYFRNKASAHDVGDKVNELSIYHVENAFYLCRVLLLIVFGIYQKMLTE